MAVVTFRGARTRQTLRRPASPAAPQAHPLEVGEGGHGQRLGEDQHGAGGRQVVHREGQDPGADRPGQVARDHSPGGRARDHPQRGEQDQGGGVRDQEDADPAQRAGREAGEIGQGRSGDQRRDAERAGRGGVEAEREPQEAAVVAGRDEGLVEMLAETRDVRPCLASAHVFVLPSYYREGLPRTILEALATGRPVITTDMPGCREPIEQGRNGFLVPPRDVDALSDAMERLLECPALLRPMGEAARQSAVDIYDVERVNRQLLVEMEVIGPDPTPASPTLQSVNDTIVATA